MLRPFSGKQVMVTGYNGFKGSWLAAWLTELGARVTGVALEPPSEPSHFDVSGIAKALDDRRIDIRDRKAVRELVDETQPHFVFHLAA